MTSLLPFEQYLAAIESAAASLAYHAAEAGLDAPVPTCPRWSMADLVAHQGMVHRWAASNLRLDEARVPSKTQILEEVPAGELLDWLAAGAQDLLATLRTVDPDVPATVFLNDPPRPRDFWARRQAHETTIHAVDALAGVLGRAPSADEVGSGADLALDGVDELLTGFFTRGRSRLADGDPFTIAVNPTDSDAGWTLRIGEGRLVTERLRSKDADAVFTGSAPQLYLGMWNRGTEIDASGRRGVLARWRALQRVRWS